MNNNEMLLRPGMTATATITVLSVENALLVSNRALRFLPSETGDDSPSGLGKMFSGPPGMSKSTKDSVTTAALNNPRVWVVHDGKPAAIPVTLGATNGKLTEIKAGALTPGTPLIVEAVKEAK